jgi:hypothetical protein
MRRRWLRPSLTLYVVSALLCGALVAGPALANPATRLAQVQPDPDDDDTPVPPAPPPAPAPPPTPGPPPAPAPPPAPPAMPPAVGPDGMPIFYGPGPGYGYAAVPNPYGIPPAELYARGSSLRNVGMPLTIASIVLFAVGIGLLVKAADTAGTLCTSDFGRCHNDSDTYLAWGLVSFLGSFVGLGVGIPLWAVGSYRMNRAVKMGFMPTYAQPFVTPTHNGAIAGMRLLTF